jgi:hypothetical protein
MAYHNEAEFGIKESDTGLAQPSLWDLVADKQKLSEPLQVARCTTIVDADTAQPKYMISIEHQGRYVVELGDKVSPTDIEEGMRVGIERQKYKIEIPLPPKIDASVTMMQVEEKPDVTYADVGGQKEQLEKLREVVELPLLHPERFVKLGIDPPKGVLLYGPPGTGKVCSLRWFCVQICSLWLEKQKHKAHDVRFATERFSFEFFRSSHAVVRSFVDARRSCRCESNRFDVYSCDRLRARAEVCRRRRAHGSRAVRTGTLEKSLHYLL